MTGVQLVHEYAWYCPRCSARNVTFPVPAELSDYEKLELAQEHGVEDYSAGDYMTHPTIVECCECSGWFNVEGVKHA